MKRGGTAIFLLGVSGVSLSIAMFFDSLKKPAPAAAVEREEEENDRDAATPARPTKITRQSNIHPNASSSSYRDYYLSELKKEEDAYWADNTADYSYNGSGSRWDKEAYFRKEAYRRRRQQVPVGADKMLAVRLERLEKEFEQDPDALLFSSDSESSIDPDDLFSSSDEADTEVQE